MPSRRALLRSLPAVSGVVLAGCTDVLAPARSLSVFAENYAPEPQRLSVLLFREDVPDRRDALVDRFHFDLGGADGSREGVTGSREEVVPARPYRVAVERPETAGHFHYRPSSPEGPFVRVTVEADGDVVFGQDGGR